MYTPESCWQLKVVSACSNKQLSSLDQMEPYSIYTDPHTYLHTHFWHNYISCHRSLGMPNTFMQPSHSWAPVPNTSSVPSQHAFFNQLTFISLLCSSMRLYGPFSSHKSTFVHHSSFLEESICIFFFFCMESLWCVDVSTGIDVAHGSQTALHVSRVAGPLLFCILRNSACQLRKIDGRKPSDVINPAYI